MAGNIWVLVDHWRGRVSDITFETLALGREIADARGVALEALLLGHQAGEHVRLLGKADTVISVDHAALAEPVPEPYVHALVQLAESRLPQCILIPLTNSTLGVGSLLSARLQAPAVDSCKDIRVSDGGYEVLCVLYGGKIEAMVGVDGVPAILGVSAGARPADAGRSDRTPPVEEAAISIPEAGRVRFKRYLEPEAGDIDITRQDVLLAVGRGIQSKDNIGIAEELAQTLGGAVCGSRPVIDQGWLPLSRQVGKSGATVKSKLYLSAGISGAPEHIEGMKDSGLIVAINTDPRAPIFDVAHYGIVADAQDVMPALTEAVRARKG